MKALSATLLLCFLGFGCARIYRPVALAPGRPQPQVEGLAAIVELHPWGDNSRYEERALHANLRVLVLSLENRTGAEVEVLGVELPEASSALSAEEALQVVKQQPLLYLLYPLIPGLIAPGTSNRGSFGPSDRAAFTFLAIVGLAIGIPNAIVAARSNDRLGTFFHDQAWAPGSLRPGQTQVGLLFLRTPDPYQVISLQLRYRTSAGEQRLAVTCPGARPL